MIEMRILLKSDTKGGLEMQMAHKPTGATVDETAAMNLLVGRFREAIEDMVRSQGGGDIVETPLTIPPPQRH